MELKQRAKEILAKLERGSYRMSTSSRDYDVARALANMGLVEITSRVVTRTGCTSYLVSRGNVSLVSAP